MMWEDKEQELGKEERKWQNYNLQWYRLIAEQLREEKAIKPALLSLKHFCNGFTFTFKRRLQFRISRQSLDDFKISVISYHEYHHILVVHAEENFMILPEIENHENHKEKKQTQPTNSDSISVIYCKPWSNVAASFLPS